MCRPLRFPLAVVLASLAFAPLAVACSSSSGSGTSAGSTDGSTNGEGGSGGSTSASSSGSGAGGSTSSSGGSSGGGTAQNSDAGSLDPASPPGKNFDLAAWELQEPVGSPGNPTTITPAMLEAGYSDAYFFTDPADGAMTFWDPEDGVTTANSSYPRSELREMNADGSDANWPVTGTNTLSATVAVTEVPDHVCVGQIHIGSAIQAGLAASTKPLLELFYHASGEIEVGIESSPTGSETDTMLATVPLGTKFTYTIALTGEGSGGGTIAITVNGATMTFPMPSGFVGYGEYFKAGDYDQTAGDAGASVGAKVKFYALSVSHG